MTTAFTVQTLSTAPRLHVIDGFLDDMEIEHVLGLAVNPERLAPGLATTHDQSGFSFEMPVGTDVVLRNIRSPIATLLGFGNDEGATFRFRRYAPGESHPQHTDAFSIRGSELIVTAMIGLVAPDAGGETHFPLAADGPIAVSQRRGRLVLWFNHTTDGEVDQQSAHSGSQVTSGEKTTLTAFVYKPAYYATSPFPAEPREVPKRRLVCLHAGHDGAATRAWVNAAEWVGFAAHTFDARTQEHVPDADVLFPVDQSPAVRRVLTAQYRDGWTNVFTGAPRLCSDALLYLSRAGLPVRLTIPCASADAELLATAVERVGGFPVEAWIGTWLSVHDVESLARLVQTARVLRQEPSVRAPLRDADRRWIAVVNDRCIGPAAPASVENLAVRAVGVLHARTGVVEYVVDASGTAELIGVNAPADLAQIPGEWWAAFCLAVMEGFAQAVERR